MQLKNNIPYLIIVSPLSNSIFYNHYGIFINGTVFHFNETQSGTYEPIEKFLENRKIISIQKCSAQPDKIIQYYTEHKNIPYNGLSYNCEHFATGCLYNNEYSPHKRGYILLTIILSFILVSSIILIIKLKK